MRASSTLSLLSLLSIAFFSSCGGNQQDVEAPGHQASEGAGGEESAALSREDDEGPSFDGDALQAILGDEPRAPLPLNRERARLGEADAEITILFFSDLECPYCAIAMRTIR